MILFVDDERRVMDSYVLELKLSNYDVHYESNVDDAWAFFQEKSDRVELLILDLMMPSGSISENQDTTRGLRTGVHFFRKAREVLPECPVIILTNLKEGNLSDSLNEEKKCWYIEKTTYLPYELVEIVGRILRSDEGA